VHALRGVDFDVRPGEVHALVGENGAGKSTLVKIITGAHAPDAGTVTIAGQTLDRADPLLARRLGVAPIYQQPTLFPELTVAENLAFGLETGSAWRRVDWRARRERAASLLARVGATVDPDADAGSLRMAEQQLVEIARALGAKARVIIMDEPTAALAETEAERLLVLVAELRASGVGIVYISHRLPEVLRMADRVTVLRDGAAVETRPAAGLSQADLIRAMVGRDLDAVFPKRALTIGDVALSARGLSCGASGVRGVDLDVRAGEILGLAGLVGSGANGAGPYALRPHARRRRRAADPRAGADHPLPDGSDPRGPGLRPRGPAASRGHPRDERGRQRDARRPSCPPLRALPRRGAGSGRSPPPSSRASRSRRRPWTRPSHTCPAATSRRSPWRAGWRRGLRC
jgi:ABC-type branched-subunit amino acid transport system ATPase component